MATIGEALVARLAADGTVAGLVTTRIYRNKAPLGTARPYLVYQVIDSFRDHALDGPTGLNAGRVQFSAWAATHLAAKAIADAVRASLDGYRGTLSGVAVRGVTSQNEVDLYDDDTDLEGVVVDFTITFVDP